MWLGNESLSRAGLRSGMRFVDVAAGSGALAFRRHASAHEFSRRSSSVMLDLLDGRARKEGLEIEVRVMDGQALELDDDVSTWPDRSSA